MFIRDLSAIAQTVQRQLKETDWPNGQILRNVVRLELEIAAQDYMLDPEAFRAASKLTWLQFPRRFYDEAEMRGPPLITALDNLLGAFISFGLSSVDYSRFERKPHPPLAII